MMIMITIMGMEVHYHDHDHYHQAPVYGVVHQHCAGVSLHHLDPLQRHCKTNSPQASVQLLGLEN